MNIRPLAKVDYVEWRKLWIAYLDFYETSLSHEVIEETFSKLIDNNQRRQNALVAEGKDGLVGLVHYIFIHITGKLRTSATCKIFMLAPKVGETG